MIGSGSTSLLASIWIGGRFLETELAEGAGLEELDACCDWLDRAGVGLDEALDVSFFLKNESKVRSFGAISCSFTGVAANLRSV